MREGISIEIKKKCLELRKAGVPSQEIYDKYFKRQFEHSQSFNSFARSMRKWSAKTYPDIKTLEGGTYEGFVAHDATVQVSANGEIIQAWIKQTASEVDLEEFLEAVRESVEPYTYVPKKFENASNMLEIPLFDMHWGVSFMDYYKPFLDEILRLIRSHTWRQIVIPVGQDFFHNDSIVNGQTTKGTVIEKVDMMQAVKDGRQFMYAIIDEALDHADEVKVVYTPGNHDQSISWMFVQVLLERYGAAVVDDAMEYRKVITYGKNSVMLTHGDGKKSTAKDLAHMFAVVFPEEFAQAAVREIHAGHLHQEGEADIYGVMVRRLSTGNRTDEWANREGFVGTHKRFMVFVWNEDKLESIHYI